MGEELQYPTIKDSQESCPKHPGIKFIEYAGQCPICNNEYVYMITEGIYFPLPEQISYVGLFLENIRYFFLFVIVFLIFQLSILNNLPILLLLIFLYYVFKGIANGIFTLSTASYSVIGILTGFFAVISMFYYMVEYAIHPILLFLLMSLFLSSILLYSSSSVRALFNLSEKMLVQLRKQRNLVPSPEGIGESITFYFKRIIISIILISLVLLGNLLNYLVNF